MKILRITSVLLILSVLIIEWFQIQNLFSFAHFTSDYDLVIESGKKLITQEISPVMVIEFNQNCLITKEKFTIKEKNIMKIVL